MPLHRRLPKRGFNHETRWPIAIVNIDSLERSFEAGTEVTTEAIVEVGLIRSIKGGVKVLGRGEITKKLTLKVQAISPGAKAKIEAAGGSVEIVAMVVPAKETAETAESAE